MKQISSLIAFVVSCIFFPTLIHASTASLSDARSDETSAQYDITAIPLNNSAVSVDDGIGTIYLSIKGYAYVSANDSGLEISITKDGESFATVGASALSKGMDNASLCINLPQNAKMKQVGEYEVLIPEGFFIMKSIMTGDSESSPSITLRYSITIPGEPLSWNIDPAPGMVNELSKVTITFSKPVRQALTSYVYLFYSEYSYLPETITEGALSVSEDGLKVTIDFNPVFKEGGIFQVRLFEGIEHLTVSDGESFPGLNITYKVDAPLFIQCLPEERSTVSALKDVKIKLPHNTDISASDDFSASYVCGDVKIKANLIKVVPYDFGDPSYFIVEADDPITDDGNWKLLIEKGSLIISNYGEVMQSPEIYVDYIVNNGAGCQDVEITLNVPIKVYNLQGICIKENISKEDLKSLPTGLYIINGHKTYIQ